MEEILQDLKQHMGKQLEQKKKKEYEHRIERLEPSKSESIAEVAATQVCQNGWSHSALCFNTQGGTNIKSTDGKPVVYQFAIVDTGHTLTSSYDLALSGTSDNDDEELHSCSKPCLGVRVVDFKRQSILIWSLAKLEKRLQLMRQMHQYLDRSDQFEHRRLDDHEPFSESWIPQFSRIGEARVSLAAIFQSHVQDLAVDVISPFTFNVVGILNLSLQPSVAEAPDSTLKFNVVLHDMAGFSSLEGTDVHAQLFISLPSGEKRVITTELINGFNKGTIHFDSVHALSLPISMSRESNLRISIFARITSMHLDKLLSWDDMQDTAHRSSSQYDSSWLTESEPHLEEKHDVFAKAQILELTEHGEYEPVDVIQGHSLDHGAYQLHQGIQRRIVVDLTHTCGKDLPWKEVSSFRAGQIRLLESASQFPEPVLSQPEVALNFVSPPDMTDDTDGTSHVTLTGQWDSSAHATQLLDRTTSEKNRIQLTLQWDIVSSRLVRPLVFSLDVAVQVRPRSYVRASSIFAQLWAPTHVAHSTTRVFLIGIKPITIKSIMELSRTETRSEYVKGEEVLKGWVPRGTSLVRDYIVDEERQYRTAEIEAVRGEIGNRCLTIPTSAAVSDVPPTDHTKELLSKFLRIWRSGPTNRKTSMLNSTTSPENGAAFGAYSVRTSTRSDVSAIVQYQPKNPSLRKSGYLLMPDPTESRWVRRYLELRMPFLHIHSVPGGDELIPINLRDSRVYHQPKVTKVLQSPPNSRSKLNVFAVYARQNTFLFATRSEREKLEWVMRIDESYLVSNCSPIPDDND